MSFIWNDRSTTESSFEFAWRPAGGAWQSATLPANSTNSMTYYGDWFDAARAVRIPRPRMRRAGLLDLVEHGDGTAKRIPAARIRHGHRSREQQPSRDRLRVHAASTAPSTTTVNSVVGLVPFRWSTRQTHDEFEFDHWEGACAGQGYSCTVTVNQALTTRAVFVKIGNSGP